MSRRKEMLPVVGRAAPRSAARKSPPEDSDACCGAGEDRCGAGGRFLVGAASEIREARPEASSDVSLGACREPL